MAPVGHTIPIGMDETLVCVGPLTDTSGESANSGSHHRPLRRMSRETSQQSSPQHSNAASDKGALDGFFSHPAGLVGQTFTFIQILTDTVGSRIAIRIHRRPVTAMGGTPRKSSINSCVNDLTSI